MVMIIINLYSLLILIRAINRVPADKHPEIAPNEFANFIKTHGANTPTRRASSLQRRKSILSQSLTSTSSDRHNRNDDEEAELNRTLSEKKRIFLQKVMIENQQLKGILYTYTKMIIVCDINTRL